MERKIFLITNAGEEKTENFCAGVKIDAYNYKSFFKASYGGFWSDSEILHLDKPSKAVVINELSKLKTTDFSIIIFCGHGWYSSISKSSIIDLNIKESIDSNELRSTTGKRIVILDSCRKVYPEYIVENLIKARALLESTSQFSKLNPESCKYYYNKKISECPNQLLMAYASDINELAGDSSTNGGYYSSSLLKSSIDWVEKSIKEVDLSKIYSSGSFALCHLNSIPQVTKISGDKQHPQIERPRQANVKDNLPFVIIA